MRSCRSRFLSKQKRGHAKIHFTRRAENRTAPTRFSTFVDGEKTVAQGGNGVVVPGCPKCKKRFVTMPQFLDHLAHDVIPALVDRLAAEAEPD
jgi:hypothetical protein